MALPSIPVVDLGEAGFDRLAEDHFDRVEALLTAARRTYGRPALRAGDRLSRLWAARAALPYREEVEAVAARIGGPGAWLLNLSYEWGCTTAATGDLAGGMRLLRALDWLLPGLGRQLVVARRRGPAGDWANLTWPGFIGSVQGVAPGRFALALNQAPSPSLGLGRPLDWLFARLEVWRQSLLPPAFLLRQVLEECTSFAEAKARLEETPVSAPVLFALVGTEPGEAAFIERLEHWAVSHDGPGAIANHWLTPAMPGRRRPHRSPERLAAMRRHLEPGAEPFAWLAPPILNERTRAVFEANPATGELLLQGVEPYGFATARLALDLRRRDTPGRSFSHEGRGDPPDASSRRGGSEGGKAAPILP